MEEAGLQVEKLALSAAEGLGEYGRTKAAQSRESVEKVWLKSLSISCCNLASGISIFFTAGCKIKRMVK